MKMKLTRSAIISDCKRYRFQLSRCWDAYRAWCCWIMLNPSTADDQVDDPTIRRCMDFAKTWGYGGIFVVNLFAWRATDPKTLADAADPGGEGNGKAIISSAQLSDLVICAWGTGGKLNDRGRRITDLLTTWKIPMKCLGVTKCGHPKHPLYMPKTKPLMEWPTDRRDV